MNSFHMTGRVARTPEFTTSLAAGAPTQIAKFTLMRNEYRGRDDQGVEREERVVAIPFVAFGARAEAIGAHVMEGDQLIITARIENNRYESGGQERFDYNFVVENFEFGAPGKAKRARLNEQA